MRTSPFGLAAVLIVGLAIGGMALAQGVLAQSYPPPAGSLTVTAPSTTVGSTTDVTATVLDNDGNPVEGAEVIFTIVSQPGTDAQWGNGSLQTTAITDANGVATVVLSAGSTAGNIIVETVSGEKTSQVTIAVAAEPGVCRRPAPLPWQAQTTDCRPGRSRCWRSAAWRWPAGS